MILDELNEFCDATSLVLATGTHLLGDQIDLQDLRSLGGDQALYLVITVDTEVITAGTAGTLKFQLASDAQAAIDTTGTATIHAESPTFVTDDAAANSAQLSAGATAWAIQLPLEGNTYERYLGVLAVVGGQAITAGAVNAFLTKDVANWKAYDAPFQL
jgi:hypothetical protein